MLKHQLNDLLDFAEDAHQCVVVCAHPAGDARTKDKEMNLKVPDQYSVSGSRMWANQVDNFLVVHRPYADDDPTNTAVNFYARKIKQEGFVKTSKEGVRVSYERGTARYLDPKLGHAPLDMKARQRYCQHGTNNPAPPKVQRRYPSTSPRAFAWVRLVNLSQATRRQLPILSRLAQGSSSSADAQFAPGWGSYSHSSAERG